LAYNIPAALLAEAHLAAGDGDDGRLGVRLADLVAAVVVAALAEVGLAAVHRARRALRPGGATGPRARALHRASGRRRRGRGRCRYRLLRPVRSPELAEPAELEVHGALCPARRPARCRRGGRPSSCGGNARRRRWGRRGGGGGGGGDGRRHGVVLQVGQVPGNRHLEIPIHEWERRGRRIASSTVSPSASAELGAACPCPWPSWSSVCVSFTARTVPRPVCWVLPSLSSYRPLCRGEGGNEPARHRGELLPGHHRARTEANKSSTGTGQMPQISRGGC
jgi:hypothetical protein